MWIRIGCVAVAMLIPAAAQAKSFSDTMMAQAGKLIAEEQCSSCHTVAGADFGSAAAPSFAAIAAKRDGAFLRAFLKKKHGYSPSTGMTEDAIESITAYIEGLKT